MAVLSIRQLWVLGMLIAIGSNYKQVVVSGQVCNMNVGDLATQCSQYTQKSGPRVDPSHGCCDIVKKMNVACACYFVTPEVEQLISLDKAVYVMGFCGVSLNHGMKCGSYTFHEVSGGEFVMQRAESKHL